MAGKTLVAFATKSGVNAEAANVIADALRKEYGIDVTATNLKNKPDIGQYEN